MAHRPAHHRRLEARRHHEGRHRQPPALSGRRPAALAALALALAGCAPGWDAADWARARPELAGRPPGRLGDVTPHALVAGDALVFFWCRWPRDAPLRVALPADATPDERALLGRALGAWEQALPGLQLAPGEGAEAPLRIRFRDAGPEGARTTAVCRVEPPLDAAPLRARLVGAEVVLRRREGDAWGRPVALGADELLGSALHELGHALGHPGHARRGASVMVRDVDAVRRIARRVARGGALDEPALAAVYALPPGRVIEQRPLAAGAATPLPALPLLVQAGERHVRVTPESEPTLTYYLKDVGQLLAGAIGFEESFETPGRP